MSLKEILERNPNLTINDFQELQKEYDAKFIAGKFNNSFDKVRHTYAHMGKLMGRLAGYIEAVEEGHTDFSAEDIKNKVIPDLLVYSAWLAGEFSVNIEEVYVSRVVGNLRRLYSDKVSTQELDELESHARERFQKNKL